ncbi:MAG: radical SAM protein [Bacteroidales bacterium]|nr:radical SAM protein [Bacteroidales bacterium]
MPTFLFHDLIYGPIKSRRLGNSLGVNLLPTQRKYCNFNCIYCECGANDADGGKIILARRAEIAEALSQKLKELHSQGIAVDSITFAGNGEPTIHPDFEGVMEDTVNERNKYYPEAQISVLSNATRISNPDVVKALMMIDNRILKLDSAIEATAKAIDRPVGSYSVAKIVDLMKGFNGKFTMQTMFLEGDVNGQHINNMTDEEVSAWLEVVKATKPKQVMIYTIDRATPEQNLRKATHDELDAIRDRVKAAGFEVSVSY